MVFINILYTPSGIKSTVFAVIIPERDEKYKQEINYTRKGIKHKMMKKMIVPFEDDDDVRNLRTTGKETDPPPK